MEEPSGFEQVTRARVDGMCDDIRHIRQDMDAFSKDLREIIHVHGNRLPNWGATIFAGMCTTMGAMAMWIISHVAH